MKVTKYQLTKWVRKYVIKTMTGFRQGVGQIYSKNEVAGYYNDLREKVLEGKPLAPEELPTSVADSGKEFLFTIGVMQYGLACYDLYLMEHDEAMKQKLYVCADWAVQAQDENGGWKTFDHIYPDAPYSAMAQGEGVSMLVRAYKESGREAYLEAAKKAFAFMLVPVEEGGVCISTETDLVFKEYMPRPVVFNGWVFALWGVYDLMKQTGEPQVKAAYEKSLRTLERWLPEYDTGYWSRYDREERIASPQYHKLMIDQMAVMYDLTGHEIFETYLGKFEKYRDSFWCSKWAFVVKAAQKISGR